MTVQLIVGVLLIAALAYAWYTERTRRREAELQRDVATRRTTLNGIQQKLDENKVKYDTALHEISEFAGEHPIPPHMLEHVGKSTVVTDLNSGARVDVVSGKQFASTPPKAGTH